MHFFVASKMRFDRAGRFALLELLAQTRHLRCTDGRDGVYAFLGLVREDYGIVPDYSPGSGGIERLLVDVACRVVKMERRLDVLSYACVARRGFGDGGRLVLPSWVPDWSCGRCGKVRERTVVEVEGEVDERLTPRVCDGGRLEVHGYKVGTFENGQRFVVHLEGVGVWVGSGQEEDEVWALVGARNPFVLRRVPGGDGYRVVREVGFKKQTNLATLALRHRLQSEKVLIV